MKICPIALQICQNKLKILPKTKWTLSKWPKCFNIVAKRQSFTKSGHTICSWQKVQCSVVDVWWQILDVHWSHCCATAFFCFRVRQLILFPIIFRLFSGTFKARPTLTSLLSRTWREQQPQLQPLSTTFGLNKNGFTWAVVCRSRWQSGCLRHSRFRSLNPVIGNILCSLRHKFVISVFQRFSHA